MYRVLLSGDDAAQILLFLHHLELYGGQVFLGAVSLTTLNIGLRTSFEAIIDDLVRGAVKYSSDSQKLTGNIMRNLIAALEAQPGSFDLKRITLEQIADAVSDVVIESGVPEERLEAF